MTKYFVDVNGNYLGGFSGAEPPDGAVEVPTAPESATQQWLNGAWSVATPRPDITGFFQALGDAISLGTLPADFYLLGQILKDQPDLSKQQLLLARFAQNPSYTPELKAALNALMAQFHLQLPPV